ncbi:2907_t:CDS:1, partial [Ambispora leptoticha]
MPRYPDVRSNVVFVVKIKLNEHFAVKQHVIGTKKMPIYPDIEPTSSSSIRA